MSEPLTEATPELFEAAPEVPDSGEAVVDDSGSGESKVVPAERFNGLMSKFNKTNEELAAERESRMLLEARLQEFEALNNDNNWPKETDMADVSALQSQVELLTQMLAQQQVTGVKNEVLSEFPDIAPFIDLIEASDADSFRNLASTLNERVQIIKTAGNAAGDTGGEDFGAGVPNGAPVAPPAVEVPVFGGGSGAVTSSEGTPDRIAEAIRNKDFGAFMRAKTEATASELTL